MALIARRRLDPGTRDVWREVVSSAQVWAEAQPVSTRDAVVLLPFAQHLGPARRAWTAAPGWMPRIETTLTLARSLAPPPPADADAISFDPALDRLAARRLLGSRTIGQAWQRRDARGFDQAVDAIVQTAHAFARAAAQLAPGERGDHWARGRELLGVAAGPGGTERLLARIAFEWAASAGDPPTDALFALRPSAWIVVQAGGPDRLVESLLGAMPGVPSLVIDTDAPADDPLSSLVASARVSVAECADFEAEAQRSAAEVLAHLNDGVQPVALIAQDRLLMRRVRALLARRQVPLLDETGWKLSTTRAGATLAALLKAAGPRATADDWLDWLKCCAADWPERPDAAWAIEALEGRMRRQGWITPAAVDAGRLPERSAALWAAAQEVVGGLRAARSRSVGGWLLALRDALERCGAWAQLQSDDAGRQALSALHLTDAVPADAPDADPMTLADFSAWLADALEDAPFVPEAPDLAAGDAPVVITPLARASLRPFAAAVFPGADEKRLGAMPAPPPLLSDAQAGALGLPTAASQRQAELLAFAQLLRVPRLTLLRRLDDGGEPLAPSPLLERLRIAARDAGRALAVAADTMAAATVSWRPVRRPAPSAPALLPTRLSASAYEALRVCPYRFFASRLLSLRESDELDDAVEKRDYGTWLHAVLHRFHVERRAPLPPQDEEARLHEVARRVQQEMRLDEAAFLPFAATFARLAPRYVQWLHERDREGAQWLDGERELKAAPEAWGGVEMHGVIDRIDSVTGDDGPVLQLIDYKTGSAAALRSLVKQPHEDTQLAYYAALMAQQSEAAGPLAAVYLPLDDSDGIKPIEHQNVEQTAQQLIAVVGRDLAQLRGGAPMPALGEGSACDFCEARGLCRRDHWSPADEPGA
jgi:ATP-dependent helicase/nuclease subunit B